jgi:hypothetical protein
MASAGLAGEALSATRIHAAFEAATVMLVMALAVVLLTIVRPVAVKTSETADATDAT